ncbi:MAG: hypothetical protein RMK32_01135 [Anaerolineae bacterium]|nr:hypothetical protein [Thermoflexus sp.]MDW8064218.1 hypothetical protein [Anaerolineae bacterium]
MIEKIGEASIEFQGKSNYKHARLDLNHIGIDLKPLPWATGVTVEMEVERGERIYNRVAFPRAGQSG